MRNFILGLVGSMVVAGAAGCGKSSSSSDGGGGASGNAGGASGGFGGGVAGANGGSGGGVAGANGGSGGGAVGASGGAGGSGGGVAGASGGDGGRGGTGGSGGGTAACAFAYTYTIVDWSGPDSNDGMTLTPPSSFHYQGSIAILVDGGQVFPSCDPPMPACNDPARIDVSDVEAAAANTDVQAAFAMTTGPRFGEIGGTIANFRIFGLSRSDGRGMVVGVDCPTPAGSCTPIPAGIKAFVALLDALVLQQRADPSCAGVH
jgi:hypothetical protein